MPEPKSKKERLTKLLLYCLEATHKSNTTKSNLRAAISLPTPALPSTSPPSTNTVITLTNNITPPAPCTASSPTVVTPPAPPTLLQSLYPSSSSLITELETRGLGYIKYKLSIEVAKRADEAKKANEAESGRATKRSEVLYFECKEAIEQLEFLWKQLEEIERLNNAQHYLRDVKILREWDDDEMRLREGDVIFR